MYYRRTGYLDWGQKAFTALILHTVALTASQKLHNWSRQTDLMLIPSHNQISDHVPPFSWAPANAVHIGFKTFMNLYFSFKPNFVHIFLLLILNLKAAALKVFFMFQFWQKFPEIGIQSLIWHFLIPNILYCVLEFFFCLNVLWTTNQKISKLWFLTKYSKFSCDIFWLFIISVM